MPDARVILLDTNIWLALAIASHANHFKATDWFAAQSRTKAIAFSRMTQLSLLRLLTTEKLMQTYGEGALTNEEAWQVYDGFRADRRVTWLDEPAGLDGRWQSLASRGSASPKLWMDAYLAAFAVAGGHQLVTSDHAFSQFKGLNVVILR